LFVRNNKYAFFDLSLLPLKLLVSRSLSEDPRMLEQLLAVHSPLWLEDQQVFNDVFGLLRDHVPGRRGEVVLALLDFLKESEVVVVLIIEGREARESKLGIRNNSCLQDVKHHSDAPVVALLSVWILIQNLRGHVAWGSTGGGGQCL
jgi:hypothetical protein